jgi:hypothetical protein
MNIALDNKHRPIHMKYPTDSVAERVEISRESERRTFNAGSVHMDWGTKYGSKVQRVWMTAAPRATILPCMIAWKKKFALVSSMGLLLGVSGASTLVAQSTVADEFSRWPNIYVDDHCKVLTPDTGELQSNPDVCHLDGMGVHRSSHVAAKEVDGVVQHTKVNVAEQTYLLQNVHSAPVVFVVAQEVPEGWHIDSDPQPKAMEGKFAIFRVNAQPGEIVRLHVGMAHETSMDDQQ